MARHPSLGQSDWLEGLVHSDRAWRGKRRSGLAALHLQLTVSLFGGSPRWRADGRELFFIGGDGRIASVSVELKSAPVVGEPRSVSKVVINPEPFGTDPLLHTRFDVTPKGDRFLIQTPPDVGIYQLTLVQRWQDRMAR